MTPEQERRNARAQSMGYRNDYHYRQFSKGDSKYFNAWARTSQGQDALRLARAEAKAQGQKFRKSDLQAQLIAARNSRPSSMRPAGAAYLAFQQRYGMAPGRDWVAY